MPVVIVTLVVLSRPFSNSAGDGILELRGVVRRAMIS